MITGSEKIVISLHKLLTLNPFPSPDPFGFQFTLSTFDFVVVNLVGVSIAPVRLIKDKRLNH